MKTPAYVSVAFRGHLTKLTRCENTCTAGMCRNRCCEVHVVSSILCMPSPCGFVVSSLSVPLLSTEHKLSASQETVYPWRTAHSGLCTVHPAAPALASFVPCPPSTRLHLQYWCFQVRSCILARLPQELVDSSVIK